MIQGWPYILAALFAVLAYKVSDSLPDEYDNDQYISEKYENFSVISESDRSLKIFMGLLGSLSGDSKQPVTLHIDNEDQADEVSGLLSEIDTDAYEDKASREADEQQLMLDPHVYNIGSNTPIKDEDLMYHI